jgi:hypothetical protein
MPAASATRQTVAKLNPVLPATNVAFDFRRNRLTIAASSAAVIFCLRGIDLVCSAIFHSSNDANNAVLLSENYESFDSFDIGPQSTTMARMLRVMCFCTLLMAKPPPSSSPPRAA